MKQVEGMAKMAFVVIAVISAFYLQSTIAAGRFETDLVHNLPGAPPHSFKQYAGYIPVDEAAGRALFYWLQEAEGPEPEKKPLTLWLNGGPGCSSVGGGAMSELGAFYPNQAGDGLKSNSYSWNRESNMLFLEEPAGVGFSYSNSSQDYVTGDARTAKDAHTFLQNWFAKFPHYKGRDFFITGESYAGHYIPQLAMRLWEHRATDFPAINFKGFAIGNAWTDTLLDNIGCVDWWWQRALISTPTYKAIMTTCNFTRDFLIPEERSNCPDNVDIAFEEMGDINLYAVYADVCTNGFAAKATRKLMQKKTPLLLRAAEKAHRRRREGVLSTESDPCVEGETERYLNLPRVQASLHANVSGALPWKWSDCTDVVSYSDEDDGTSVLYLYRTLLKTSLKILIYSGDVDGVVPITGTRAWLQQLEDEGRLVLSNKWAPWYLDNQVGGYSEGYNDGRFLFWTVRDAGHMVPYTQPARALKLFSEFLKSNDVVQSTSLKLVADI